jgi:hypothetical protein
MKLARDYLNMSSRSLLMLAVDQINGIFNFLISDLTLVS